MSGRYVVFLPPKARRYSGTVVSNVAVSCSNEIASVVNPTSAAVAYIQQASSCKYILQHYWK